MKDTNRVFTNVSRNGLTVAEELAIRASDVSDAVESLFRSATVVMRALRRRPRTH